MKLLTLILSAFLAHGQEVYKFEYPSNDIPLVEFWIEGTTNICGTNWQTIAFLIPRTNQMEFYRIGVKWADTNQIEKVK